MKRMTALRSHAKTFLKCLAAGVAVMALIFAVQGFARPGGEDGPDVPQEGKAAQIDIYRADGQCLALDKTVRIDGKRSAGSLAEIIEENYHIDIKSIRSEGSALAAELSAKEAERLLRPEESGARAMLLKSLLGVEGVESVSFLIDGRKTGETAALSSDGLVPGEEAFLACPVNARLRRDAQALVEAMFSAAEKGRVVTCRVAAGSGKAGDVETLEGRAPGETGMAGESGPAGLSELNLSFCCNGKGEVFGVVCSDAQILSAITPPDLAPKKDLLRSEEKNADGGVTMVYETDGGFLLYFIFSPGSASLSSYSVISPQAAADVIRSGGSFAVA